MTMSTRTGLWLSTEMINLAPPGALHLEKGFETIAGWEDFAEKKFSEWQIRQASQILKLPDPQQDLPALINLLNEVRKLNFERLEFRACRIGINPDELKSAAQFFGAQTLVGPKEVRTFYGVIGQIEIIPDPIKFTAARKRMGGRSFAGIGIAMQIGQHSFRVVPTDKNQAQTFIQNFISFAFSGSVNPFVIGGLEPAGKAVIAGKAHVFPLESDYRNLLSMFPAPSGSP
jgi:hypothetical protein